MADHRASAGLPTIFAIFLGLMVTAFIGVGVYTFYPPPREAFEDHRHRNVYRTVPRHHRRAGDHAGSGLRPLRATSPSGSCGEHRFEAH